ncbi:MAG TPA: molybdenum cofactor biosynthesis protein MoaE [Chloroflexota bacterium]|nr:molybdenum cofactor biosynthesis protein MoaE [Chloroflexota bacterium]
MIELRGDRLSVEECLAAVRRPGCGGIALFVGSVRDVSEGKSVRFLEYEAYEPMALEKLHEVVAEARARWPVESMAIQHRVGRLDVGDDAVVVAVSCPHRAEAFAACKYAIDRLKEIVPIWKKEHGDGGAVWVGGPTLDREDRDTHRAPD